ncbi:MAG: hypothetical protein JXR95_04765 [Deltaproteobacteria bacterium]|nr:hypothetical protein [Deltaproteobacteria bacterium]
MNSSFLKTILEKTLSSANLEHFIKESRCDSEPCEDCTRCEVSDEKSCYSFCFSDG